MLNRAALLLKYKEPAVRWINEADPYPDGKILTIEDVNRERTVYLISDADAGTDDDVRRWVEANFLSLWEWELEGWYTDERLWPTDQTLNQFDEWFDVEYHTVLIDTVDGPLMDDEV
ncbi:hypothetical protein B1C78_16210 [Thioalkalivibrio denitrificans]|uniref:Uncharacterized protein n=1 Tax=Thioalkalivibrio denitrificans TaxID=108003 RepID=A0A1V3N8N6_9GAMM|nr:hypothetical protein [Thioalkalivibrio denitrificans]OOG21459.1 hypothetical protein B1C78_16210 [Thioalkalivibrio denitrificans]